MSPKDRNILETLNLLVLLYRSRKRNFPALSEQEQSTLNITEELLQTSQMTLPIFVNSIEHLSEKGYLVYMSAFAQKARDELTEYKEKPELLKVIDGLASKDTTEVDLKLRSSLVDIFQKIAPKDMTLDVDGLMKDEEITLQGMLQEAHEGLLNYTPDIIATVILLPFRSIERLLDKMNSGMRFDEVQDDGMWYDSKKYEFHYNGEVISTSNRGSAIHAHFVLDALFNSGSGERVLDYSDVSGFTDIHDPLTANKRYCDAMRNFVTKNPKIEGVFKVYTDRIEIAEDHKGDIH